MTILEALSWGQQQLKETAFQKRIMHANPMLDAQVLLAACLQKPTAFLFIHGEDELSPQTAETFQRCIQRRKRHEPVAHILQQKDFYGRPFFVNQFVLTPRPETELLVETVLGQATSNSTFIDIGTGSGIIAITLAIETGNPVVAIDVDAHALEIARHNAKMHQVDHLVSFHHGSLLQPYEKMNIREPKDGHSILCANLPYLTPIQWELADPDVREYEPKRALIGGVDGLELYDQLFQQILTRRDQFPARLEVILEIDPSQEDYLRRMLNDRNIQIEFFLDMNRQVRVALCRVL